MTGCSFGGYHAVNFALKHPDVVTHCVSMSGAFDIHQFLDGYYDNDCYFNNPPDFLPNMSDDWFLSRYRQMKIVLGIGRLGYVSGPEREALGDAEWESDSALAGRLERQFEA